MFARRPAWVDRLIHELKISNERAAMVAKDLSPEQLNWKPHPASWSVGQCLAHLQRTNEVYLPAILRSLERSRKRARVDEIVVAGFSQWFIRNYIAPNPDGRRARAPKKIRPVERVAPSILDAFLQSNERAQETVLYAKDYDVNRVRFKNPFVPLIRFTVGVGLEIVSKHESRHLLQAENLRNSSGFPPQ